MGSWRQIWGVLLYRKIRVPRDPNTTRKPVLPRNIASIISYSINGIWSCKTLYTCFFSFKIYLFNK
jgi:hypothetical protein